MPYIAQDARKKLDQCINHVGTRIDGPGELNYVITRLCWGQLNEDAGYSDFNELIGVLECAKLELYRRLLANYEDSKIQSNGDLY